MRAFNDNSIMEKTIETKPVFDGIILHIEHTVNLLPNGKTAAREIARHVGASAILPVDKEGNVYLVRQFRAPVGRVMLEIPAGKLDSIEEDRLYAAKRELREETGLTAGKWTLLTDYYTTPGFCDEKISIYLAEDLLPGTTDPDDDEFLNIVKMPFDELRDMALRGEIQDSKTIIAVLAAERRLTGISQ